MIFLDSGVIVSALYRRDNDHAACLALIEDGDAFTSAHTLAETFCTLTGQYRVKNDLAAEAVLSVRSRMHVEPLLVDDYASVLGSVREHGVMGGLVYDALHAQVARRLKAEHIYTLNVSNFEHVAGNLGVRHP